MTHHDISSTVLLTCKHSINKRLRDRKENPNVILIFVSYVNDKNTCFTAIMSQLDPKNQQKIIHKA